MLTFNRIESDTFASMNKAINKTNAGDNLFKVDNFLLALESYSKAIGRCPENAEYYCNRSRFLLNMGCYMSALVDSQHAVALDEYCEEGYDCFIRCCISLGNIADAENAIMQVNQIHENNENWKKYEKQCQKLRSIGTMVKECLIDGEENFIEAGT